MAKGKNRDAEYVTQSQWAEGMGMIKDFFGKLFDSMEGIKGDVSVLKKDVSVVKGDVSVLKKDVSGLKGDVSGLKGETSSLRTGLATLEFEFKDFRKEQRQMNKELEKKVEMNTEAINLLGTKLQETQKLEFTVFKHGQRITKLEKAKQK